MQDKFEVLASTKPRKSGRPTISDERRMEMQAQIAETADQLFRTEGYGQVSMRRIAKEIGCSPMTIYKYYDAKIDILRTLWWGVFEHVFAVLELTSTDVSDAKYLEDLGALYVKYWLRHPEQYRLVFMAEGVTQPEVSVFLDNPNLFHRFNLFADAISKASSTQNTPSEIKPKLDFFLSALHGIAHNHITITGYTWSSPETQIRLAVKGVCSV